MLIARIYEVFPLLCPKCGGQMRLIAFITEGTQTDKILDHIGVDSKPPHISPARGPPLWDDCDAHVGEGVASEPDWDLTCEQRILAVDRPGTALLRGAERISTWVEGSSKGDTWPHAVEMPIRACILQAKCASSPCGICASSS